MAACTDRTEPYRTAALPPVEGYKAALPVGTTAFDNNDLTKLFVQLTTRLESGRDLNGLQRFEGPVNVGITGDGANIYRPFLREFLADIRANTGIDISAGPPPHNLLIRMVPGEEMLPGSQVQCFILSSQPTWDEFETDPEWYNEEVVFHEGPLTSVGIFIPDTLEPYKVRECISEEVTQALGTSNDLYGLATTIFNDDDAHTWPTKLDYLMLKVLYDPRLKSGLGKLETFGIAGKILDEVNPAGRGAPPLPKIRQTQFKKWRLKLHESLNSERIAALQGVRQVAKDARNMAPGSAYDCTGAFALAAVGANMEVKDTEALLTRALNTCTKAHGDDDIRIAHLRLIRAFWFLDTEKFRQARSEAEAVLPKLIAYGLEDDITDAKIILVRSAFELKDPKLDDLLDDATRWAAFAYGDDHELTQTLRN